MSAVGQKRRARSVVIRARERQETARTKAAPDGARPGLDRSFLLGSYLDLLRFARRLFDDDDGVEHDRWIVCGDDRILELSLHRGALLRRRDVMSELGCSERRFPAEPDRELACVRSRPLHFVVREHRELVRLDLDRALIDRDGNRGRSHRDPPPLRTAACGSPACGGATIAWNRAFSRHSWKTGESLNQTVGYPPFTDFWSQSMARSFASSCHEVSAAQYWTCVFELSAASARAR